LLLQELDLGMMTTCPVPLVLPLASELSVTVPGDQSLVVC
jgi:hypothetical protein